MTQLTTLKSGILNLQGLTIKPIFA
ncbi:uncharacterized protein METZ01_LOCUS257540, partial [marine metagenome]